MENNKLKVMFAIVLALLFILPITATAMDLSIVTPTNGKTYTHSTALPLDITLTSSGEAINCKYSIDWGVTNTTTSCVDMGLDIPIINSTMETQTFPVHLQYFAINSTSDEIVATTDFFIYSNITEAKAIILVGVIFLVLVLGLFFMIYALKLGEDLGGLKLLFMILSFVCTLLCIHLGNLAIREYIRFTPIMESYDKLYFSAVIFVIVVFIYILIMFLHKAITSIKGGGK